ncbi:MAG: hypothetical protein KatS3mg083_348 [Candidatus Dojkabacteria bacterium]|nr:MAG: hypothetical protein KatS3mg084_0343 [Candidatus Dojkabacteria bacterium]GIW57403.1 MAG: hypothetical protein KatS3mg083_348 [Candidatus Dojkabacteria bacterium]
MGLENSPQEGSNRSLSDTAKAQLYKEIEDIVRQPHVQKQERAIRIGCVISGLMSAMLFAGICLIIKEYQMLDDIYRILNHWFNFFPIPEQGVYSNLGSVATVNPSDSFRGVECVEFCPPVLTILGGNIKTPSILSLTIGLPAYDGPSIPDEEPSILDTESLS